jgi:hypothetical protein
MSETVFSATETAMSSEERQRRMARIYRLLINLAQRKRSAAQEEADEAALQTG